MNNKIISDVEKMFENEEIHFGLLGKNFPGVMGYFIKRERGEINRSPNGVRSVVLKGTGEAGVPSTFGYLPRGDFKFDTGLNEETMHFLTGNLSWGINREGLSIPQQYEKLIIPSRQNLILQVRNPSLYICDYSPRG